MEEIPFEEYFYDIYRFMYCCKIEHKQEGQHRVGRDDYEYCYKYYEFCPREGYHVPQKVINKINLLLKTNLKFEDKEESIWEPHPARYCYCDIYSSEYFYGWAETKDLGSYELKKASFIFISNYFIKEYLIDQEDFKRFLL